MDWLSFLEWLGAVLGLSGAFILATNRSYSRWGWWFFLAANFAMIALALGLSRWGLLAQQVGFVGSSFLGVYRAGFLRGVAREKNWVEKRGNKA